MPLSANFYLEKIAFFEARLSGIKKTISLFAVLRLIGFTSFLGSFYLYFSRHEPVFLLYAVGFFIVFIWLVKISLDLKEQQSLNGQLLFINQNELDLSANLPSQFDHGQVFQNSGSYLADLDIFGEKSLFHLLNRTTTSHGSAQLAGLLA